MINLKKMISRKSPDFSKNSKKCMCIFLFSSYTTIEQTKRNFWMFSKRRMCACTFLQSNFLHYRIRVSKGLLFSLVESNCTKKYCKFHCANIPISLWKRESCSAKASTLHESYLHCTKRNFSYFFCAIYQ